MEYDIIGEMAGLAAPGKSGVKLARAAGLLLKAFGFDQCCIYVYGKSGFALKGHSGKGARAVSYGPSEGAPGLGRGKRAALELYKLEAGEGSWRGVEDRGLKGFRYALVQPLEAGGEFHGVIYLKSIERKRPGAEDRRRLRKAALQLTLVIKYAEIEKELESAKEELKEARAALKDSERLITLGDMAAALAHEIKNPLISIGGFAARLGKHLGPDVPGAQYLERIFVEVARLEKVMDGAFRFIKDSSLDLKPEDMNAIAEEAIRPFEEDLASGGIELRKDLHQGRLPVLADREQLKIAFDNLIANAIQSMEKGGVLTMTTALSGQYVLATVADTGAGIEPDAIDKIFNPFFTTKRNGTGLGLTITRTIVARHKGSIKVESRAGAGAAFIIMLPHAAAEGQAQRQ
ncbi:MAG: hypothetical protein HY893_06575 [Deltaproteobacteria bacterium]|nr:hypothetical protein [Deltaproteobacteria bacterium]